MLQAHNKAIEQNFRNASTIKLPSGGMQPQLTPVNQPVSQSMIFKKIKFGQKAPTDSWNSRSMIKNQNKNIKKWYAA